VSLQFFKMSGSGNDFIMVDGRAASPSEWPADRIVRACDRRRGVGADGLVVLTPERGDAVRMHFFNSDGGRAAMCGNAALCSTRLAARLGLAPEAGMTLCTDAGELRTRCVGPGPMAEINLPDVALPEPVPAVAVIPGERDISLTTVGVPHLVVRVDDLEAVDITGRGRALRFHPALGGPGANANFVAPGHSRGEPWLIRTYERGVEGETLACGTGTVAAALALAAAGEAELPVNFVSRGGGPLSVAAVIDGNWARDVWLCGEGRLVFTGELAEVQ
jgi:diaminopimelate epimerase